MAPPSGANGTPEEWGSIDSVLPGKGCGQGAWLNVDGSTAAGGGGGKSAECDGWRVCSPSGCGSERSSHVSSQADNWASDHEEGSSGHSTGENGEGGEGRRHDCSTTAAAAAGSGLSSGPRLSGVDGLAVRDCSISAMNSWEAGQEPIRVDLDRELDSYTGESTDEDMAERRQKGSAGWVGTRPADLDSGWGKSGRCSDFDDLDTDSLSSSDRDTVSQPVGPSHLISQGTGLHQPALLGAVGADCSSALSGEPDLAPPNVLSTQVATRNGGQGLDTSGGQFLPLVRGDQSSSSAVLSQESPQEFGLQVELLDSASPGSSQGHPSLDMGSGGGGGGGSNGGGVWGPGRTSIGSMSSVNGAMSGSAWKGDSRVPRGLPNRAASPRKNSR